MADVKTNGLGFLDLPAELRIDIYRYVFSTSVRTAFPHPAYPPPVSASASARLLACCKSVNSEARPIFFEVTDFALRRPGDLFQLRAVAGQLATRITRLTFGACYLINKTRIKELRAFKSLRAVGFGVRTFSTSFMVDFDNHPLQRLETIAISEVGGHHSVRHSLITELMRQRPSLRYTINTNVKAVHLGSRVTPCGVILKVS